MIFGYMRISTQKESQTTDRQKVTLDEYAKANNFKFDDIFQERISGTVKTDQREEYEKLKNKMRSGDILIITDLDRLGRDADNVIMEFKTLKQKGIKVVALDIPYLNEWHKIKDDDMYNMIVDILITLKAHMAEQERKKTVTRINQGLDAARAKGVKLGRPQIELSKDFIKEYNKFKNGQYGKISAKQFAKMQGIGRSTLYKYIKQIQV